MARLLLFGAVREAAERSEDIVEGETLAEVLATARLRYGEAFSRSAGKCKVWVNGEVVPESTPLRDDDEVALLPPVSGG